MIEKKSIRNVLNSKGRGRCIGTKYQREIKKGCVLKPRENSSMKMFQEDLLLRRANLQCKLSRRLRSLIFK